MGSEECTIYCGNLSEKITEDLLYELFLQAGPLESVTIPKDKHGRHRSFGFVAFKHQISVPYAIALMNGIPLYGRPLHLDSRSSYSAVNPYLLQLQEYFYNVQRRVHQAQNSQRGSRYSNRRKRNKNYNSRSRSEQGNNNRGRHLSNSQTYFASNQSRYATSRNSRSNRRY